MLKLKLHWQILIAFIIAVILGITIPQYSGYIKWLGDIFLRALKMIIVPLVFSSIVSGVANIGDAKNLGRIGIKTFGYYLSTSLIAILLGLFLVNMIRPGIGADLGLTTTMPEITGAGSISEILLKMIPSNIVQSLYNADMLAIIFFSILFGFFITRVPKKHSDFLLNLFNSVFEVMMKLTSFVIKFAPLGILGIVTGVVAEQAADKSKLISTAQHLGIYFLTVLTGLIIHTFIILPLIIKALGKINPFLHFKAMSLPIITAFTTSSSSATLPFTMEAIEQNAGVSNKISSFVLPLGATVNMNGTALYECVAAMFIAQAYGIELSIVQQIIVVITALLAAIGSAGIPMAGLVMMSVVLSAVNLPLEGIGLILAVDRPLDMFRTVVNVFGDTCGAVTIAKSEGEILKV